MKKIANGEIIFENVAMNVPNVLLPENNSADFWKSWACVACDQYTSQLDYWQAVEKETEGKESTYNLMLPEIFLEEPDADGWYISWWSNLRRYERPIPKNHCQRLFPDSLKAVHRFVWIPELQEISHLS